MVQHFPKRFIVLVGGYDDALYTGFTNAAGGIVDDALEIFFIDGVYDDTQVSQEVLYLLALVERGTSQQFVWDIHPAQAFFKRAALRIGAVQDNEIFIVVMIAQLHLGDGIGYKTAFIVIGKRADQRYF